MELTAQIATIVGAATAAAALIYTMTRERM